MSKRRARKAPYNSQPGRRATSIGPSSAARRSPLLVLGLVALTVIALVAILLVALSHSGTGSAGAATGTPTFATPLPGAAANLPPARPLDGIGVLAPGAGLAQPGPSPAIGKAAPDFIWLTPTGHSSLAALRGHPVLLEMFAPWCTNCQVHAPLMNDLLSRYRPKGLQIVAVTGSPYGGQNEEQLANRAPVTTTDLDWFRRTYDVFYPLILDSNTRVFNLYGKDNNSSIPTFFLIDRRGILRYSDIRAIADSDLTAQIRAIT